MCVSVSVSVCSGCVYGFLLSFFCERGEKSCCDLDDDSQSVLCFQFLLFIYLFYHIQMCAESHLRSLSQGRRFRKTHVLSHNFYSFMVVES